MEPTYYQGDILIVNHNPPKLKRGTVILFTLPTSKSSTLIKRIVGLPGETVSISNGSLFINGIKLDEHPYYPQVPGITPNLGFMTITLDQTQYFVLGDNRQSSFDSRSWGPLAAPFILGEVIGKQ